MCDIQDGCLLSIWIVDISMSYRYVCELTNVCSAHVNQPSYGVIVALIQYNYSWCSKELYPVSTGVSASCCTVHAVCCIRSYAAAEA